MPIATNDKLPTQILNHNEDNEFNNLNINQVVGSNSSDNETEQRIFQFSPLSSKKQLDDDEEQVPSGGDAQSRQSL